jgi:hypothetical protein
VILVDTSIWVDHLRAGDARLAEALDRAAVFVHPFIVGELACGLLRNRSELLRLLRGLPGVPAASDDEALDFIERHRLMGRGVGYIGVHLLVSAALSGGARIWSRDRGLAEVAAELDLAHTPTS